MSSPPFSAATLPVVSAAGATNANHCVSRNGLTPSERKQRQLAVDASDNNKNDNDDPLEDVTEQHRRWTTTSTAASLESDDDMLSVYDDLGNTLNSSSHPNHKTMVGMARSTVGMRSTSSVIDEDKEDNVNGDEDDDNNQPCCHDE